MAMPGTVIEDPSAAAGAERRLRAHIEMLERRLRKRDEQRRAMLHIMGDLNESNKRLANQRKAMLHILADYERDRRRMARQTERLDNSRRAVLHILQDSHKDKLRLEASRKAMIHIMGDLRETTTEMQRREQELRDKQEQLVQAGKLATLGELTTGVAHELNNPLNNIGLFVGNAVDLIEIAATEKGQIVGELRHAMQQVSKATEIISHLRTFGRAAPVSREPISLREVIERALLSHAGAAPVARDRGHGRPGSGRAGGRGECDSAGAGLHQPVDQRARRGGRVPTQARSYCGCGPLRGCRHRLDR